MLVPVLHPFPVRDAERREQRLARERLQRLARYALDDVAEQVRSTAIVIPHGVRRRRDRLRQDIAERIGFIAEMRFVVLRIFPGAILVPLNARRHGQEMAKGDVVPARRFQRRIVRKEFDDGLVGALDQLAIDRDPDQQRDHALRDRAHVVLGRRIEIVPPFARSPGLVIAREILLEHELAVARRSPRHERWHWWPRAAPRCRTGARHRGRRSPVSPIGQPSSRDAGLPQARLRWPMANCWVCAAAADARA